ncbi:MAG: recombination protein O N-terminal domain-containing protein [Parcubacteria group bacterium]|nr:recombination protein O N-terminal domain-containing protein [Parcubacteria group bacterium]
MYHIYHTEGIILASVGTGEADRFLRILTPDFGLIGVVARGSRLTRSKMKYHLSEYRHVAIDIVRGKNAWTLTGVQPLGEKVGDMNDVLYTAGFARFIRRLVQGEEQNAELFHIVQTFLKELPTLQGKEEKERWYLAGCMAVLDTLGYASAHTALAVRKEGVFSRAHVAYVAQHTDVVRSAIDEALAESHL